MRWIAWSFCAAAAACSGTQSPPRPPAGGSAQVADAGPGAAGAAEPSERECEELITHTIALGAADRARTAHGEPPSTDEDFARLEAELRANPLFGECRSLPRAVYRCVMAAASTAALVACR